MATRIASAPRPHQFDVPPITTVRDPRLKKSFFKIFAEWVSTTNHPLKGVNYAGRVMELLAPTCPKIAKIYTPEVALVGKAAGLGKNVFNTARLPKDILETSEAVRDVRKAYANPTSTRDDRSFARGKAVRKLGDLLNDSCDAISVFHEASPLKNIAKVKLFSSWSTFLCSLSNFKDDLNSIAKKADTRNEKIHYGLGLGISCCYIGVGISGILAAAGVAAAGTAILAFLIPALILSVVSFWFGQIVDPLGQNQDPSKVLALAKRRVEVLPTA